MTENQRHFWGGDKFCVVKKLVVLIMRPRPMAKGLFCGLQGRAPDPDRPIGLYIHPSSLALQLISRFHAKLKIQCSKTKKVPRHHFLFVCLFFVLLCFVLFTSFISCD